MGMRVLIHVQHLWGIGHLQRMAALARTLMVQGAEVHVATGGVAVPGLTLPGKVHPLTPAVKAQDQSFQALLTADNQPVSEPVLAQRREQLVRLAQDLTPDAVVIETWPFGRRLIHDELLALVAAVKAQDKPARVFCSIRDIPEPKTKPGREEEIAKLVADQVDEVLVHGWPEVVPFNAAFGAADDIAEKLTPTGYVYDHSRLDRLPPAKEGWAEIIVSAGGGRDGEALLRQAMAVRASGVGMARKWRFLLGPGVPESVAADLREQAAALSKIVIEDNRADFPALLGRAILSISQAGYNTVTDIIASGVPALLIPRQGPEQEQRIRARAMADRLSAILVSDSVCAAAITDLLEGGRRDPHPEWLDGARRSAAAIMRHLTPDLELDDDSEEGGADGSTGPDQRPDDGPGSAPDNDIGSGSPSGSGGGSGRGSGSGSSDQSGDSSGDQPRDGSGDGSKNGPDGSSDTPPSPEDR